MIVSKPQRIPALTLALVAVGLLAVPIAGHAADTVAADEADASPLRGTTVSYMNVVSANTLDKNADLTYNPYHAMMLQVRPRWWFGETAFLKADFSLSRELTNADDTTDRGETVPGDVRLGVGASPMWNLPGVGIDTGVSLDFELPTSPISRGRTRQLGIRPGFSLRRSFDVLQGIGFGYGLMVTRYMHEYTTTARESPNIEGCGSAALGCEPFLNSGVRNTRWRVTHIFDASVSPLKWLSASASIMLVRDSLHPSVHDPKQSVEPQTPTDTRELVGYDLEVAVSPLDAVQIAVGASTFNPQLAPDSTYYAPFFNQYTTFFVDLRLSVAQIFGSSSSGGPSGSSSETSS